MVRPARERDAASVASSSPDDRASASGELSGELSDEAFRSALRGVLARSGRSMRGLSAAMGRDPGYVGALLDPSRPSRARPTPADLARASDATGLPLVELLEALWAISPGRLATELVGLGLVVGAEADAAGLSPAHRRLVGELVAALARSGPQPRRSARTRRGR